MGFNLHRHIENRVRDSEPMKILTSIVKNVDHDIPFEDRWISRLYLGYFSIKIRAS